MLNRLSVLAFSLFVYGTFAHAQAVTEAQFEWVGEQVVQLYDAQLKAKGIYLSAYPEWSDSDSNAMTEIRNYPYVNLKYSGGFIKKNRLSLDALALVLCHEIGHLLGKRSTDPRELAAEGEADYFATRECLPKVWKSLNLPQSTFALPKQEIAALKMRELTPQQLRSLTAAYEATAKNLTPRISFQTPDTQVLKTRNYPSPQCRLDTYLAGALQKSRPACWNGL